MSESSFDFEILPDGRIKVLTSAVAGPVHLQAEQFFQFLSEALGAPVVRARRVDVAVVERGSMVGHVQGVDHSH